jgi:hypothetical protein
MALRSLKNKPGRRIPKNLKQWIPLPFIFLLSLYLRHSNSLFPDIMRLFIRSLIPALLFLVFFLPFTVPAQTGHVETKEEARSRKKKEKEEKKKEMIPRWEFGINFGTYFANKYTANYYNGSDGNVNSISYVMTNKYWYEEIKLLCNAADTVIVREIPTNMHYHTALDGGLFFRYNFTRTLGLLFEFDYAQLKTDDLFTVEVDPAYYLTEPDLRLFGIHGKEQRLNFDLTVHYRFPVYKQKMNLFLEGGLNVNYVRVLKSFINIYDHEYSIINIYGNQYYIPNANLQEYENLQGGVGYGLHAGGGVGFMFSRQVGMEFGGYMNYSQVALVGYGAFSPSGGIFIRFVLTNLIGKEEE